MRAPAWCIAALLATISPPAWSKPEAAKPEAAAKRGTEEQPVLLVYGADWCGWSRKQNQVLQQPETAELLKHFAVKRISVSRMTLEQAIQWKSLKKKGVPTIAVMDAGQSKVLAVAEGYQDAAKLSKLLKPLVKSGVSSKLDAPAATARAVVLSFPRRFLGASWTKSKPKQEAGQ